MSGFDEDWEDGTGLFNDGIDDQALLDLDVDAVAARQEELLRQFPKCVISPEKKKKDVLARAVQDTIGSIPVNLEVSDEIEDDVILVSSNVVGSSNPNKIPGVITAEVSAKENGLNMVAKKSSPPAEGGTNVEAMEDDDDCKVVAVISAEEAVQQKKDSSSFVPVPIKVEPGEENVAVVPVSTSMKTTRPILEKLSIAAQITKSVIAIANSDVDETGTFSKNGEEGFIKHDFPVATAEVLRGPDPAPSDIPGGEASFISVRELAIPGQTTRRTVPAGLVPFVVVEYEAGRWSAISIEKWKVVVNQIEVHVQLKHKELRFVLRHARKWRGCGTISLCGLNSKSLEKWRDLIPIMWPTMNTFPRDSLIMSEELTMMLTSDLESFNIEGLSYSLFSRNPTLKGNVRVTCSKRYGPGDYTVMLEPKNGWRLCYLEGDALFLQSLAQHTSFDRFEVGCGLVTIKGGLRKPNFLHKRFAPKLPWDCMKWVRAPSFPVVKDLAPVPMEDLVKEPTASASRSTIVVSQLVQDAASSGIVRSKSLDTENRSSSKPRTRSERLRLQRAKKLAFKKKMKSAS